MLPYSLRSERVRIKPAIVITPSNQKTIAGIRTATSTRAARAFPNRYRDCRENKRDWSKPVGVSSVSAVWTSEGWIYLTLVSANVGLEDVSIVGTSKYWVPLTLVTRARADDIMISFSGPAKEKCVCVQECLLSGSVGPRSIFELLFWHGKPLNNSTLIVQT